MGTWREICTEQNLSYILLLIITIITMAYLGRVYSSQVVFNRMALLIDSMIELVLGLVWTKVKPYMRLILNVWQASMITVIFLMQDSRTVI